MCDTVAFNTVCSMPLCKSNADADVSVIDGGVVCAFNRVAVVDGVVIKYKDMNRATETESTSESSHAAESEPELAPSHHDAVVTASFSLCSDDHDDYDTLLEGYRLQNQYDCLLERLRCKGTSSSSSMAALLDVSADNEFESCIDEENEFVDCFSPDAHEGMSFDFACQILDGAFDRAVDTWSAQEPAQVHEASDDIAFEHKAMEADEMEKILCQKRVARLAGEEKSALADHLSALEQLELEIMEQEKQQAGLEAARQTSDLLDGLVQGVVSKLDVSLRELSRPATKAAPAKSSTTPVKTHRRVIGGVREGRAAAAGEETPRPVSRKASRAVPAMMLDLTEGAERPETRSGSRQAPSAMDLDLGRGTSSTIAFPAKVDFSEVLQQKKMRPSASVGALAPTKALQRTNFLLPTIAPTKIPSEAISWSMEMSRATCGFGMHRCASAVF